MSKIVDFKNPPVVETVVGVQFDKIPTLRNAHLGRFWDLLGDEWPIVNDAPPLSEEFEKFGEAESLLAGFQVQLSNDPTARLMIRNHSKDRLIQIQNSRFHVNWLGSPAETYPRYDSVRNEFDKAWQAFCDYVERAVGQRPKPNQWEVTYVNLIPRGTVWDDLAHIDRAFNFIGTQVTVPCGRLERLSAELHFEIEPQRGRLHVNFANTVRKDTGGEALNLTLTSRGPITADGIGTVAEGLDIGREAIVRAFKALTTDEARKHWGEIDVNSDRK